MIETNFSMQTLVIYDFTFHLKLYTNFYFRMVQLSSLAFGAIGGLICMVLIFSCCTKLKEVFKSLFYFTLLLIFTNSYESICMVLIFSCCTELKEVFKSLFYFTKLLIFTNSYETNCMVLIFSCCTKLKEVFKVCFVYF